MVHFTHTALTMPGYYLADQVRTGYRDGKPFRDTLYHQVTGLDLVNQLGHRVHSRDLEGKIVLVNFFHPRCPGPCRAVLQSLKTLQTGFALNDSALLILSISLDSSGNQVSRLKHLADSLGVDQDTWWFLSGDPSGIRTLAREDFFGTRVLTPSTPLPLDTLVVLDKHRFVRGYYDGLYSTEVRRCARDIGLLMLEREKR